MRHAKACGLAILSATLLVGAAVIPTFAQTVATVKDIDVIQADTLRTLAQAANADAKASLKQKGGASGSDTGNALPNFKAVKLYGDVLYAELLYGDSSTKLGKVGDTMPGCLTITKITMNQVDIIDCERKPHTLGMSGTPPTDPVRTSVLAPNGGIPMVGPMPNRPVGR